MGKEYEKVKRKEGRGKREEEIRGEQNNRKGKEGGDKRVIGGGGGGGGNGLCQGLNSCQDLKV